MKTQHLFFAFIFISMTLFSCMAGDIGDMHTISPEGNREINIAGEKAFKLDPIMVTIDIKTELGEKDFSFEVMAPNLDPETVKIEWRSNDFCTVSFKQNNGGRKIQHIDLSDGEIRVQQEIELGDETQDIIDAMH